MYAFVDVQNYQKVSTSDASLGIEAAANTYLQMMGSEVIDQSELFEKTIKIRSLQPIVIEGNTYYYLISEDNEKFSVLSSVNLSVVPYLRVNDQVNIQYRKSEIDVNRIVVIDLVEKETDQIIENEGDRE